MIRRDCVHYHCEHDMGASIDCCTLRGLGDCPCSNDCNDYANKNEIYLLGLDVFRKRKEVSAQPERKKGKWITQEFGSWAECSECHELYDIPIACSNFCPNCGADMRGEQE